MLTSLRDGLLENLAANLRGDFVLQNITHLNITDLRVPENDFLHSFLFCFLFQRKVFREWN